MSVVKLLVVGPPGGTQGDFVGAISEVKIKSSAHAPSGGEFIPLDFGRVSVESDLDLQVFGVERDRVGLIADAIAPGIVGAILLVNKEDTKDPHFSADALSALIDRGIALVVARTAKFNDQSLQMTLALPAEIQIVECKPTDRESVKATIIKVLETALESQSNAA